MLDFISLYLLTLVYAVTIGVHAEVMAQADDVE